MLHMTILKNRMLWLYVLISFLILPLQGDAQIVNRDGIQSVSPSYGTQGQTNLEVIITLKEASAPPSQVDPNLVKIADLEGRNIRRNEFIVVATFDIPSDELAGAKDVAVVFPAPNGQTLILLKEGGFTVYASGTLPERTVGLMLREEGAYEGYTLFAPLSWNVTYLIDMDGRQVHSWPGDYYPGNSVYLLENGHLLHTCNMNNAKFTGGGTGGRVQEVDWDGNVIWEFEYSTTAHCQHHDVEFMPNGNILMIAWEYKSNIEAIEAGRDTSLLVDNELWPDHIIEVNPATDEIVWEWHVWDHLIQDFDAIKANYGVVQDHPERIDINYTHGPGADWNHLNGIDYNEELDQIIVSSRELSEFWIIDHSTTTQEAADHIGGNSGQGGDLLYRWGNPRVYNMGGIIDQKLFFQHDTQWIASDLPGANHILVFNNGDNRPGGNYSSVDELDPPMTQDGQYIRTGGQTFGPDDLVWTYYADPVENFYSSYISGAQRFVNGNTLICSGANGRLFEVTENGTLVWEYINPVTNDGPVTQGDPIPEVNNRKSNNVFRAYRYDSDYPGLQDKILTPGDFIEGYPTAVVSQDSRVINKFKLHQNFPNPFNPVTAIGYQLSSTCFVKLDILNILGQTVKTLVSEVKPAGKYSIVWDSNNDSGHPVKSGVYFYRLTTGDQIQIRKMTLLK